MPTASAVSIETSFQRNRALRRKYRLWRSYPLKKRSYGLVLATRCRVTKRGWSCSEGDPKRCWILWSMFCRRCRYGVSCCWSNPDACGVSTSKNAAKSTLCE
ncbi:unnamed protein product [Cylicocyclus nassatus]|uniref:Uncharacterized protein n=1 Tax=Cylicocyclus nassatus TaxID=53992 RepID=A0AA36MHQ2_CYLNA|nr:unnamed protein product [Cylicocyclus nassatus]